MQKKTAILIQIKIPLTVFAASNHAGSHYDLPDESANFTGSNEAHNKCLPRLSRKLSVCTQHYRRQNSDLCDGTGNVEETSAEDDDRLYVKALLQLLVTC